MLKTFIKEQVLGFYCWVIKHKQPYSDQALFLPMHAAIMLYNFIMNSVLSCLILLYSPLITLSIQL